MLEQVLARHAEMSVAVDNSFVLELMTARGDDATPPPAIPVAAEPTDGVPDWAQPLADD
jgi:hypothetical protein